MSNNRVRTIQIDYGLFLRLISFFAEHADPGDPSIKEISKGIHEKLEAMEKHALYTSYKTAATAEERERARNEYLKLMGIPESFRWPAAYDTNVMHRDFVKQHTT